MVLASTSMGSAKRAGRNSACPNSAANASAMHSVGDIQRRPSGMRKRERQAERHEQCNVRGGFECTVAGRV